MVSNINLPKKDSSGKPYLSYSQLSSWKKERKKYFRRYFFGEPFVGNPYTDFGTKVGTALEKNDFSGFSEKEQQVLRTVPRHSQFEKKVVLNRAGFYLLGFVDTNTDCLTIIKDYKTGEIDTKEVEYKSDDYTQLEIYSAAIQQEVGVLPSDVSVILIDRKGNPFKGEPLRVGDKFITITKDITQERIDDVLKDIDLVANDISDYYKVFLKLKEIK